MIETMHKVEDFNAKTKANNLEKTMRNNEKKIYYLKDRWLDEKKYEDFEIYKKALIDIFKEHGTTFKVNKNFHITIDNQLLVKININGWKIRVSKSGNFN